MIMVSIGSRKLFVFVCLVYVGRISYSHEIKITKCLKQPDTWKKVEKAVKECQEDVKLNIIKDAFQSANDEWDDSFFDHYDHDYVNSHIHDHHPSINHQPSSFKENHIIRDLHDAVPDHHTHHVHDHNTHEVYDHKIHQYHDHQNTENHHHPTYNPNHHIPSHDPQLIEDHHSPTDDLSHSTSYEHHPPIHHPVPHHSTSYDQHPPIHHPIPHHSESNNHKSNYQQLHHHEHSLDQHLDKNLDMFRNQQPQHILTSDHHKPQNAIYHHSETINTADSLSDIPVDHHQHIDFTDFRKKRDTTDHLHYIHPSTVTYHDKRIAGCIMQCIFEKNHAVDKLGWPTLDGLVNFYSEGVNEHGYFMATLRAVDHCLKASSAKYHVNRRSTPEKGQTCDVAFDVFDCISDRITEYCSEH